MPRRKKKGVVIGVFETRAGAEQAMAELKRAGFKDDDIGMIGRDKSGRTIKSGKSEETYADEGAVAGAVAGAGVGALVGVGVITGVVPVIGPVLAIGALGTILLNAAGGAAIAGIAGALIGWGIPEDEAEYYEGEVKAGKFLVSVEANGRADEARAILHRYGGFDRTGWTAVRADRELHGRTMQLHEERLVPRKNTENVGEVEVRKEVHTQQKSVTVPVEREEVVIERRPAGGRARGSDFKGEEVRIPVKEEKVNVSKEAVVKEEVTVGKQKVRDHKTVTGEVRSEELEVESEGSARVRHHDRKRS
jgi:uncharacterized protein (TIGR02271 family)